MLAGKVSGARTDSILGLLRRNMLEMLFALAPLGVLLAVGRFTWRDGLAAGFMLLASMFVINQNGQLENMTALIVIAAYGAVRVMGEPEINRIARIAAAGAFGMLAASQVLDRGMVLIDQAYAVLREEAREPAPWASVHAFPQHLRPRAREHVQSRHRQVRDARGAHPQYLAVRPVRTPAGAAPGRVHGNAAGGDGRPCPRREARRDGHHARHDQPVPPS